MTSVPDASAAAQQGAAAAQELPAGKRKLIDAALRLTAGGRSFASLGLRELAREAALNPNTFYRHFDTLDDLAREAVESVSRRLRPMLRRERWLAAHDEPQSVPRLCRVLCVRAGEPRGVSERAGRISWHVAGIAQGGAREPARGVG
jgi:AcrR family transcriptional regulator